jgi:hypothetical protein
MERKRLRALDIRKSKQQAHASNELGSTSKSQASNNSNSAPSAKQPNPASNTIPKQQEIATYLKQNELSTLLDAIAKLVRVRPPNAVKCLSGLLGASPTNDILGESDGQLRRLSAIPVEAYLDHVVAPILLPILAGLVKKHPEEPLKWIATALCADTKMKATLSMPSLPPATEEFTESILYSGPLLGKAHSPSKNDLANQNDVTAVGVGCERDHDLANQDDVTTVGVGCERDLLNNSVDVDGEPFGDNNTNNTLLSRFSGSRSDDDATEYDSDGYGSDDGDEDEQCQDKKCSGRCPTVYAIPDQDPYHRLYTIDKQLPSPCAFSL